MRTILAKSNMTSKVKPLTRDQAIDRFLNYSQKYKKEDLPCAYGVTGLEIRPDKNIFNVYESFHKVRGTFIPDKAWDGKPILQIIVWDYGEWYDCDHKIYMTKFFWHTHFSETGEKVRNRVVRYEHMRPVEIGVRQPRLDD